jgi:Ca2+-binding RTX toxin-like protein
MQGRRGFALIVGVAGAAVLVPGTASADPSCAYKSGPHRLAIELHDSDLANVSLNEFDEIVVHKDPGPPVNCTGETPTSTNTDRIRIVDTSANGNSSAQVIDPDSFAPGFSAAGGDEGANADEIEWTVDLGKGKQDSLHVAGLDGIDRFTFGKEGINPNASGGVFLELGADADITSSGVDENFASGGDGNDILRAQGSVATGAAFSRPIQLDGMVGDDLIEGGEDGDRLIGQGEEDEIHGFGGQDEIDSGAGDDDLHGGAGADELDGNDGLDDVNGDEGSDLLLGGEDADDFSGGPGSADTVSYEDHPLGIGAVISGPGSSGNSSDGSPGNRDTIGVDVENLVGTDHPADGDILTGDGGDNTLDGGLGPDELIGANGTDTVTYAGRDEPVQVSFLGPPAPTQGGTSDGPVGARDEFSSVENVTGGNGPDTMSGSNDNIARTFDGGPGGDDLAGGNGDDLLIGGKGKDRLFGEEGIDSLKAKDGKRDPKLDCGPGANSQEKAKFDAGLDPQPKSC